MYETRNTPAERRQQAELIGKHLDNGAMLTIAITHTSKSNLSYRYKVALAYLDQDNKVSVSHLTYWLASELGKKLTDNDEIKGNGCGFDRYHDTAYTIALILRGYGFDYSLQNLPKFVRGY